MRSPICQPIVISKDPRTRDFRNSIGPVRDFKNLFGLSLLLDFQNFIGPRPVRGFENH